MLAVVAGLVFIIGAVLALADKTVTLGALLAFLFIGLALLAGHLAFRLYVPDGRRW